LERCHSVGYTHEEFASGAPGFCRYSESCLEADR
jgi:hypothetical protein